MDRRSLFYWSLDNLNLVRAVGPHIKSNRKQRFLSFPAGWKRGRTTGRHRT
jgi:hypothetical protein